MITEIARAKYLGLDEKGRDRAGSPAIIECAGVRFFSLSAKDAAEADRINKAVDYACSLRWNQPPRDHLGDVFKESLTNWAKDLEDWD